MIQPEKASAYNEKAFVIAQMFFHISLDHFTLFINAKLLFSIKQK